MKEARGFARSQQSSELFISYSRSIACSATELQGCLTADVSGAEGETQGWCEADQDALTYWSQLESDIELLPVPTEAMDELGTQQLEDFLDLCHTFHTALPFSEAERVWFLKVYRHREELRSPEDIPRVMGYREERIVSAGLRQVVNGRELSRRWLAWRRQTDEYAEQGTLDMATAALGRLATLFAVPEPFSK